MLHIWFLLHYEEMKSTVVHILHFESVLLNDHDRGVMKQELYEHWSQNSQERQ